jgi:hypothetical protein
MILLLARVTHTYHVLEIPVVDEQNLGKAPNFKTPRGKGYNLKKNEKRKTEPFHLRAQMKHGIEFHTTLLPVCKWR